MPPRWRIGAMPRPALLPATSSAALAPSTRGPELVNRKQETENEKWIFPFILRSRFSVPGSPVRRAWQRGHRATIIDAMSLLKSFSDELAAVVEKIGPSVVHVRAVTGKRSGLA